MIDTLMVLLFPYLDFIPFAVPRYLMFRGKLRIPFKDGIPLSSKRDGMGVGASSIQDIAERYHGDVFFEYKEGIFYTSVILRFEKPELE